MVKLRFGILDSPNSWSQSTFWFTSGGEYPDIKRLKDSVRGQATRSWFRKVIYIHPVKEWGDEWYE